MKHNENNTLDEMQDQKMLKMEEYGYWILFWGLALAVSSSCCSGIPSGR